MSAAGGCCKNASNIKNRASLLRTSVFPWPNDLRDKTTFIPEPPFLAVEQVVEAHDTPWPTEQGRRSGPMLQKQGAFISFALELSVQQEMHIDNPPQPECHKLCQVIAPIGCFDVCCVRFEMGECLGHVHCFTVTYTA